MATEISGVFENADMAERALRRAREQRIPILSYHIRPFYNPDRRRGGHDAGVYGLPGATNDIASAGSIFMAASLLPLAAHNDVDWHDGHSQEVALILLVEESQAGRVRDVMTSNFGRSVR